MTIHVGIIMGSQSDWPTMKAAAEILDELGIPYETKIVSAHRTPDRLWDYGKTAVDRGLKVIIAGAGGAAHLPGMMASKTRVPVIGVPVQTKALAGVDSLYSILQMPKGYPVATMAIGGAANAGLMAAAVLAVSDADIARRTADHEAISANIAQLHNSLPLVRKKHEMREELATTGHIAQTGLIETRLELLAMEKDLSVMGKRLNESAASLHASVQQRKQAQAEFRARASAELVDAIRKHDAARQELVKATQRRDLQKAKPPLLFLFLKQLAHRREGPLDLVDACLLTKDL